MSLNDVKKDIAVLVVDLVNDFTQPDGKIYYETTGEMMPRVIYFISEMKKRKAQIIYIQQKISKEEAEKANPDLKTRMCCVEGTGGELLDDRLPVDPEDRVVPKTRFSGFFRTNLEDILLENQIKSIAVIGTKTNCCVRATATDACMRDYRTFLINDCVSTNTEELNRIHCEDIGKYTAKSLTSTEFLEMVDNGLV